MPGLVEAGARSLTLQPLLPGHWVLPVHDQVPSACSSVVVTITMLSLCVRPRAELSSALLVLKQLKEGVIAPVTGELYRMRKLRVWDWNPKSVYSNPHPQPIFLL